MPRAKSGKTKSKKANNKEKNTSDEMNSELYSDYRCGAGGVGCDDRDAEHYLDPDTFRSKYGTRVDNEERDTNHEGTHGTKATAHDLDLDNSSDSSGSDTDSDDSSGSSSDSSGSDSGSGSESDSGSDSSDGSASSVDNGQYISTKDLKKLKKEVNRTLARRGQR
jgi:hypothetical protein